MARKSKYSDELSNSDGLQKKWQTGLYVRLSREDGDKEESDSISNQKSLLTDYISHETDVNLYDVYIDDGWSGTNFERPGFKRMIDDIKSRAVNCVIVKDLSRFGRDYVEVGNYLEKVFPFMDVRFISVTDYLDSVKNPQSMNNLVVPFKNIINDEYCRDISNKVRSSLDLKRKQGKFIGSFSAYGYLKDPTDHNHLIIDEEAADVIRYIFKQFIEGTAIIRIAKKLNEQGFLNPTAYKKSKGFNYRHAAGTDCDYLWVDSSVRRILINKMYTGTLVQGKNKIKSYKLQVAVAQSKEKWIEVENTHEAIIDKDTFEKVQNLLKRDTRTSPWQNNLGLFSGFLKCADCKRAMNKKAIVHSYASYSYYICSTFKKMNRNACTKHTIREDKLYQAVLDTIQKQITLAVTMEELIKVINENGKAKTDSKRLEKALYEKENERKKIDNIIVSLYPDWKNGDISQEEYQTLKERYKSKLESINETISNIKNETEELKNGVNSNNAFISNFAKYKPIDKLTREILIELIDVIYIHEGGKITIKFNFYDELEKAAEFIENNRNLAVSS